MKSTLVQLKHNQNIQLELSAIHNLGHLSPFLSGIHLMFSPILTPTSIRVYVCVRSLQGIFETMFF